MVSEDTNLLKKILYSFNPDKYGTLVKTNYKKSILYFFVILLFACILSGIIMLPKILSLPSQIEQQMNAFDYLNVSIDYSMNKALEIPPEQPFLSIDTNSNQTSLDNQNVLVTSTDFLYKGVLLKEKSIPLKEYKNLKEKRSQLGKFVMLMAIVAIPSLFILFYIIQLVKYALVLTIIFLFTVLILRLRKSKLSFHTILKVLLYSSTLLLFFDLVIAKLGISGFMLPLNLYAGISLHIIALLIFLIFYIIIIAIQHSKEIRI